MWTTDVAKRAGVNPQTLRYYERRGILPAPERSPAGYRNYPEATVSVLRFIKRAQEMGFSLADVDKLLHLAGGRAGSCAKARAVTADRLADLDRRIADLQRMRRCLAELAATCRGPGAGQSCRVMVQAIENAATLPYEGLDPDGGLCTCPQA